MKNNSSKYGAYHFLVLYVGVFVSLAALGYYVANKYSVTGVQPTPSARTFATDLTYYDMPRMTISVGSGSVHMRVDVALEVAKKDVSIVEGYQPRMTAKLNSYLSTLSPERMQEAKLLPWLRAEMLAQVNSVGIPVPIHDLLFRQLVVM